MAHVTVTSEFHFAQQIASGHHRLTSDEPIARGGSDSGASPYELLLAALGVERFLPTARQPSKETLREEVRANYLAHRHEIGE